jgi:hypothetical protein
MTFSRRCAAAVIFFVKKIKKNTKRGIAIHLLPIILADESCQPLGGGCLQHGTKSFIRKPLTAGERRKK